MVKTILIHMCRFAMPAALLLPALALSALAQPPLQRVSDIPAPAGCQRIELSDGSYAAWLRKIPLKADNIVLAHDGRTIQPGFYRVLAVLGLPLLFRDDLEQCADWCFRLWGEYHRGRDKLDRFYLFDYNGNRRQFSKSGKTYRNFLRWAMANANSHSLKVGCLPVDTSDLLPGDMLVQNLDGGVGHVSVIMDVCRDIGGNKYFLIGYSFMPAQEFHLEAADFSWGHSGWFTLEGYLDYLKHYFGHFGPPVFRRFP